jgi:hypothetical protein
VLDQAAETSQVRLDDLTQPSVEQAEAARAELLRTALPGDTGWINDFTACRADYSRTGTAGDPDADPPVAPIIEREHVPALLLYRDQEQPVDPCFGGDFCANRPTYLVHCAMFVDAATGRLLRVEGCWGFRSDA